MLPFFTSANNTNDRNILPCICSTYGIGTGTCIQHLWLMLRYDLIINLNLIRFSAFVARRNLMNGIFVCNEDLLSVIVRHLSGCVKVNERKRN